jgi:hypothetical protein
VSHRFNDCSCHVCVQFRCLGGDLFKRLFECHLKAYARLRNLERHGLLTREFPEVPLRIATCLGDLGDDKAPMDILLNVQPRPSVSTVGVVLSKRILLPAIVGDLRVARDSWRGQSWTEEIRQNDGDCEHGGRGGEAAISPEAPVEVIPVRPESTSRFRRFRSTPTSEAL